MPKPGPDKALCGAQLPNKPPGVTCRNVAGMKTDHLGVGHCYRHGGCTPTHERAAQTERARQAVARFALAPDEEIPNLDPRQVLAEELHRSLKVVRGLDERINELSEIHGPTFHVSGIATGESKPHIEWVMWQQARTHLRSIAKDCHDAGVDVFYAKLAETQASLIAMFARGLLAELGIDPASAAARAAFRKHLEIVAGSES